MADRRPEDAVDDLEAIRAALGSAGSAGRLDIDPETIEQDLARLVLGLMAFLRELMELRAIRRLEIGDLTAEEEERLGLALMRAEVGINDVAEKFGLSPEDLSLDLGILGRSH